MHSCCANLVDSTKLIPWGWWADSCLPPLKGKSAISATNNKGQGSAEKNERNTKPIPSVWESFSGHKMIQ